MSRPHLFSILSLLLLHLVQTTATVQAQLTWSTSSGTMTLTGGCPSSPGVVTIPNTINGLPVSSIGHGAFANCTNLAGVTFGNGVTNIGHRAFANCTSLTNIDVDPSNPAYSSLDGVLFNKSQTTLIQYPAGKAGTYTIPDSVTSIGYGAFYDCTGLTNISIREGVMSILGEEAFYGCTGLTNIDVDPSNPAYSSLEGVLFNKSQTTLIQCPGGKTGAYTIPNSVTRIGGYAFSWCAGLVEVDIGDGVTSIGQWAFYRCTNLTSVTIMNGDARIDWFAFDGCDKLDYARVGNGAMLLRRGPCEGSVTIQETIDGLPVAHLGDSLFLGCASLTNVTIPNTVTTIRGQVFAGCVSLVSVTIPNSVTSIGNAAFANSRLTNIGIPDNVATIGASAFTGCSSLTSVTMGSSVMSIGDYAFSDCSRLTNIVIPNSVTIIEGFAFSRCSSLTDVMIGSSVMSIGDSAFSDCTSLTQIVIPNNVTTIGGYAFWRCFGLADVSIGSGVRSIGACAFSDCANLTRIIIPNNVTTIGVGAFSRCSGLTDVTMGSSLMSIGDYAFSDCSRLTNIVIPNSVTRVGSYAFSGCNSLTSVTILNGDTSIGEFAFQGTDTLNYARIGNGAMLLRIGSCEGSVTIQETINGLRVTHLGDTLFSGCASLTNVIVPNAVTNIARWALGGFSELTDIEIDSGNPAYTSLDGVLFDKDQTTLIKYPRGKAGGAYTIPNTVTDIGTDAFRGCSNLTSVTLPAGVTNIGPWAFYSCGNLGAVDIPGRVTRIEEGAFSHCTGLTNVTLETGTRTIGHGVFWSCRGLKSIIMPRSITSIESSAFGFCPNLTAAYFEGNSPSAAEVVYPDANKVTVYYLPGTTGWGPYFSGRPTALWVRLEPTILTHDTRFGPQTNGFSFIISWATNATVAVSASPTLTNPTWLQVATHPLVNGTVHFTDTEWGNHRERFYRVSQQ